MSESRFSFHAGSSEKPKAPQFEPWAKIPRLRRDIIVTEKIDGTNAQLLIQEDGTIWAGSRNRWLGYVDAQSAEILGDNFGFFAWVRENHHALLALGVGRHYGEWYGKGVQRTYGMTEKRLALFNVWREDPLPAGAELVPVLYRGPWDEYDVNASIKALKLTGSIAVPGFMQPEGVVIYHMAAHARYKVLCDNDDLPKGKTDAE